MPVKLTYEEFRDMSATLKCPKIVCPNCKRSAGFFYPDQENACIKEWNSMEISAVPDLKEIIEAAKGAYHEGLRNIPLWIGDLNPDDFILIKKQERE